MQKNFFDVTQANQLVTPEQEAVRLGNTTKQKVLYISTDILISFLTFRNLLPGTQFDVFLYLIDCAKPVQSYLTCTYRQIADSLNIRESVVHTAMAKLEKSKFLQKLDSNHWLLPPVSFCADPSAIEKQKTHPEKPIWLCSMDEFFKVIRLLKGRQLEVLWYILLHTQVDNTFCASVHDVAAAMSLEEQIVQTTFRRLEKCCFWFALKDGRWLVNGNVLLPYGAGN